MNQFDRFCAAFAFVLGLVLLLLGAFGVFLGSKAHFSLPPLLGGLPALVGYGIVRAVNVAWKVRPPNEEPQLEGEPYAENPDGFR